MMPNRKVSAGAVAGAVSIIVTWAAKQFAGVEVPDYVAQAFTVLVSLAVSYMVPEAE